MSRGVALSFTGKGKPVTLPASRGTTTAKALGNLPFHEVIRKLEVAVCGKFTPGTSISRVLADPKGDIRLSLGPNPIPDSYWSWCLALGYPGAPKHFYYGWEIMEAVVKAWDDLIQ